MPFRYELHGLRIRSNQALPAPHAIDDEGTVDLDIQIGTQPILQLDWDDAQPLYTGVESFWRLDAHTWRLGYTNEENGARWDLTCVRGEHMIVRWMQGVSLADIRTVVLNSGITVALQLRGAACLHASGVVVNGVAVLFLGASGTGKSTTAAALVNSGNEFLTDDIAALSVEPARALVHRGHSRLRLLADSAHAVDRPFELLPPVWSDSSYSNKRYLDAAKNARDLAAPAPLGLIYLLTPGAAEQAEPTATAVGPREAIQRLIGYTHGARWLDVAGAAQLFRTLARVAELVPMRRLRRSSQLADLPRLVELLSRDMHSTVSVSLP